MTDVAPAPGFRSVDPTTGEAFAAFASLDAAALEACLAAAVAAQRQWRVSAIATRSAVLHAVARRLRAQADTLARLATAEMGKTLASARAEVEKCAVCCDYYAEYGPAMLRPTTVALPVGHAAVRILPLGVVLAIMPWNFPYWQAFRFIAPALMAGNGILLKHAGNVPHCALAIERVIREGGAEHGLPPAAITNLFADLSDIPAIIADDRVVAITLTGSERAGIAVAEQAGRALKKCVLELGGSDPFIVMPSAELSVAVKAGVNARMMNAGQSCVCAKRFIVHEQVYDAFVEGFTAAARALRVGDPMQEATDLGPLSSAAAREKLHDQVLRAGAAGGRILTGGAKPDGAGYFYPPTVIADLSPAHAVAREEFFGPVAMVFKVADAAAALALANDVPFGLGSSVWTRDDAEAEFFVGGIHTGITAINTVVASDPRVPFGGVKKSGYGRELAELGLREFVNVKTVLYG